MARSVTAGAAYFAVVFTIGFVLGTIRTLWVSPQFGELLAVLIELPIILAASWLVCDWVISRTGLNRKLTERAIMGAVAFALLMTAEIGLSVFIFGNDLSAHLSEFASKVGAVGLFGQLAFAAMPLFR